MKKNIIIFITLTMSFLFSQGQKIGYVNIEYIYAQNEDARLAYADFEKEGKRLQAELENKAMTLDSLMRDYTKLEIMWTEDMKVEKRKEIENLQIEVETFQSKYFAQPNGEIYMMLQQRMAPINELIQSAIDKVAAEKAYDFVLDISQGIVLYKLDSYDLTQLVVDELNKMSINKDSQ
ncbi:MAG: hypothetical protein CMG61_06900 [Candidatus Marinimicrobia bacterium]|nr:hypothetical protein [Candidatus Neomarinimicrobiota bacterium]